MQKVGEHCTSNKTIMIKEKRYITIFFLLPIIFSYVKQKQHKITTTWDNVKQ